MRKLRINKSMCSKKTAALSNAVTGDGTIITALENIVSVAHDCELNENILYNAAAQFELLEKRLSFTIIQSLVIAMLIDYGRNMDTQDMARFLGIRNIRMLTFVNDIEQLQQRRIIRYKKNSYEKGYAIRQEALAAYLADTEYVPNTYKGLALKDFVDAANALIEEFFDDEVSHEELEENILELKNNNKSLPLCKKMKSLTANEMLLFLFCLCRYVYEGDRNIIEHEYRRLFDNRDAGSMKRDIVHRRGPLFKDKLLGDALSTDFAPSEAVSISEEIRQLVDRELDLCWEKTDFSYMKDLLGVDKIAHKEMFYNAEERMSIEKLGEMLKQDNFESIQSRMKECGMRSGFACLFYGAPGTGKTETVMQLARYTGRDIMQVNIANIKDKYVGESEKNIRGIFNRYRACCENCEVKPILLFNEADAIINKRNADASRSVEKMENAMQNIILEEMEKLDGILIATTNLTSNIDTAFERRFIYKVEFHKPEVAVKERIWMSMIADLDHSVANKLAGEFDLSGGQIENVTRKQFVDKILYGEEPTLAKLREYCSQESINGGSAKSCSRIGF